MLPAWQSAAARLCTSLTLVAAQSYMMIMIGAAGVFMQAIGLQLLLRVLGETKLIRLGVLVYGIEEVRPSLAAWPLL